MVTDDNLAFCPVTLTIAKGFADEAFEAPTLHTPEQIFELKVLPPRDVWEFKWKKEMLDVPFFRQPIQTANGIELSKDIPLSYRTYHHYLKRLGRATGFRKSLTTYCLRRGVANALTSKLQYFCLYDNLNFFFFLLRRCKRQ
jgi:hypothetical protein